MANYFIAYDLMKQGQDYEAVATVIKQLGSWAKVQFSMYYVHTNYTRDQVYNHVNAALDQNDKLIVIEANHAQWKGLPQAAADQIKNSWHQP